MSDTGYIPLEEFQDKDFDQSSRPIRDFPAGKHEYEINVFPDTLTFQNTAVNNTSDPQSIIITNSGYNKVLIQEIKAVGDFILVGNLPDEIEAGTSVGIQVAFEPKGHGTLTGGVYIDTGDAAGEEFISLSGSASATYITDLNTDLIRAYNADQGSPNYIQATTANVVPAGNGKVLIAVNITQDNTDPNVQIAFNNDAPLDVKNLDGSDLEVGDLVKDHIIIGYRLNNAFRLLISKEASAFLQLLHNQEANFQTLVTRAEDAAEDSEQFEALTKGYMEDAQASANQALFTALATGTQLFLTEPPLETAPTIYRLLTPAGVQIWTHDGVTRNLEGWLVGPKFDTVALLMANTAATFGPVGQIVEAQGFQYEVAASGATDHHLTTAGGVKLYVMQSPDGSLPLKAFAPSSAGDLRNAIEAADVLGCVLDWADAHVNIEGAMVATVSRVNWRTSGAVVTYTGAADILNPFQVNIDDGVAHSIKGSGLTFDGQQKAHIGIRFTQPLGTVTATFYAECLFVKNIDMLVGAGVGSNGLQVRGGFASVTLVDCAAENIRMRAGAGIPGNIGIQGIQVVQAPGVTGAYSLITNIIRPKVRRVYSQDASYQFDQDGIGVFANPNVDSANGFSHAKVIDADIAGCWGRDVKLQVARGEIINPTSLVNEGPVTGKLFQIYDFQTGPGQLVGGCYTIDGHVCNELAAVVRFANNSVEPSANLWSGGLLNIVNGGAMTRALIHDPDSVLPCISRATGVSVVGSLREFAYIRTNGYDVDLVDVEAVTVQQLTDALCRVEARSGGAAPYRARFSATRVTNLSASVPLVRMNVAGVGAQALISEVNCFGFTDDAYLLTSAATLSGARIETIRYPEYTGSDGFAVTGSERLIGLGLAASEEVDLPLHGNTGGIVEVRGTLNDRNAYAVVSYDSGGIANISVGSSFAVGAAADPGTGSYRIWRNGSQLRIKNATAVKRYFIVRMFG